MASSLIRAGQFTQVLRQGSIILVALALPRLGVGRQIIGEWEGLLYLGYILGFGWLAGLLQAYLVTARTIKDAARYSRRVLLSVFGVSAGLLALAAVGQEWLFSALHLGTAPTGWWWFFLFLLTQWPGLFFEQVLQLAGRVRALVAFGVFSFLGYALALILPFVLGGELADALRWLAAFAGLKGLLMLGWLLLDRRWRGARPRVQGARGKAPAAGSLHGNGSLRGLWRSAWPLILYATANGLVTAFDPWFVNYWYADDEAVFAVFRYGARDIPFVAAVTGGMIVVVLPRLTESFGSGLDLLRGSSRRLLHWVFGATLLLMVTSPLWWTPLFTEDFSAGLPLFRLFLFITVSRLLFPGPVLVALGYTRGLWLFPLAELAVNVILSILLTPHYGLWGIVLATVIADILGKIFLIIYLYLRAGVPPGRYTDLRVFAIWCGALLVGYFII